MGLSTDPGSGLEAVRLLAIESCGERSGHMAGLLAPFRMQHVIVAGVRDAWSRICCEYFDVVLVSLDGPEAEEWDIVRRLREEENSNCATPVIGLSADITPEMTALARDNGVNELAVRPHTAEALEGILRKYIEEGEEEEEAGEEPDAGAFRFDARLDTAYLRHLYGDNLAYAAGLFRLFNGSAAQRINDIRQAQEQRDWKKMRTLLHKIKPNFSMVGLTGISRSLQEVYERLRANDNLDIDGLMDIIYREIGEGLPLVRAEEEKLAAFLSKAV